MITGSRVPCGLFDIEVFWWSHTVLDHCVALLVEVKEYVGLSNESVYILSQQQSWSSMVNSQNRSGRSFPLSQLAW
jgi:hypothetical protein